MQEALTAKQLRLQARWVLPISSDALEHAGVCIKGAEIAEVSANSSSSAFAHGEVRDYGNAIIVPGFINLHTHIDYSHLRYLDAASSFLPWVRKLIAGAASWTPEQWLESSLYGARQAALGGTSFIVDSSYKGCAAQAIVQTGLKGIVGLELFGLNAACAQAKFNQWQQRFAELQATPDSLSRQALADGRLTLTIAPHAPYTVCPELWDMARQWCADKQVKLLGHLAESSTECAWLASSSQEMNDHLIKVMEPFIEPEVRKLLADMSWLGQGRSPVQHLEHFGLLDSNLLAAHCVHVSPEDMRLLTERGVTVAHCPRSNARLKNGIAPIKEMLNHKMRLGLGTDSLASCDDLDLLAEARFADSVHRACGGKKDLQLSAREILSLITIEAARAIGRESSIGSIQPGKRADLAVFAVADSEPAAADAHQLLLRGPVKLKDLYVDGRRVVANGQCSIAEGTEPTQ